MFQIFFYFAEIKKRPSKGKKRFWDLKIKINLSGIIQVNVPNFFFAEILKMTKLGPKKPILGPKNQN